MKKLKSIIIATVLFVVLHVAMVLALSDARIFSCQITPVVPDMEKLEWQDGKCAVNYKHWTGSVQRLTPGAAAARIGLIYFLPILVTAGVMYGLRVRYRRAGMIMK